MGLKQDLIAALGELVGTTMFLFLGLGGVKTAQNSVTTAQLDTASTIALSTQTIMSISLSMGFSLLVTAWLFYRITGGLFNPAITLALWLIGGVPSLRAAFLVVAQLAGGILGSGLAAVLTPYGGVENTITTLATYVNVGQGLFIEAFLTAMLVFAVLMLAAEKHKATFIAPIGIGLTLFVCQLFGTQWTGCGMNPARSFGPSVVSASFPGYHWIYWVGPIIGSLIAVAFYTLLKLFDYGSVVLGQDSDDVHQSPAMAVASRLSHRFSHGQREALIEAGMKPSDIDAAERGVLSRRQTGDVNGVNGGIVQEKPVGNGHIGNGALSPPSGVSSPGRPQSPSSDITETGVIRHVNPRYANPSYQEAPASKPKAKKRASTRKSKKGEDIFSTNAIGQETGAIASPYTHTTVGYPADGVELGEEGQNSGGIGAPGSAGPGIGLMSAKGTA